MDYRDKIFDFLVGDLSEKETLAFQKTVAGNNQLQEDVRFQQEILYAIKQGDDEIISFRKQLSGIGNDFLSKKMNARKRSLTPIIAWSAAAMITVLIGLSVVLNLSTSDNYSMDYLYSNNYQSFNANLTARGADHQATPFGKAINLYEAGNIKQALSLFDGLKEQNPEVSGFYTGLCYMESGEFVKAVSEFRNVQKEAVFFGEHIEWYLALSYLKLDNKKAAIDLFTKISASTNRYSKKASDLMQKLS